VQVKEHCTMTGLLKLGVKLAAKGVEKEVEKEVQKGHK
jgi:hypothetical protein